MLAYMWLQPLELAGVWDLDALAWTESSKPAYLIFNLQLGGMGLVHLMLLLFCVVLSSHLHSPSNQ